VTCIAGLVDGRDVWMGGDSAGVADWALTVRRDPKVFRVGEMLIGFTSSFRMGQLLRHRLVLPEHQREVSVERWLAVDFVDAVRTCLADGGWREKDKDRESGGHFLVGYRGVLAEVESDFQVGLARDRFAAVGCGAEAARGALWALQRVRDRRTPPERLRLALGAAERLSAGVRGPFTILRMERRRREP